MDHTDHILDRMDLDRVAAANVLTAMSEAGVDLDQLATASGFTKTTLVRRLGGGSFSLRELMRLAHTLGCSASRLIPHDTEEAAS